jgi:hypothetical protein
MGSANVDQAKETLKATANPFDRRQRSNPPGVGLRAVIIAYRKGAGPFAGCRRRCRRCRKFPTGGMDQREHRLSFSMCSGAPGANNSGRGPDQALLPQLWASLPGDGEVSVRRIAETIALRSRHQLELA